MNRPVSKRREPYAIATLNDNIRLHNLRHFSGARTLAVKITIDDQDKLQQQHKGGIRQGGTSSGGGVGGLLGRDIATV